MTGRALVGLTLLLCGPGALVGQAPLWVRSGSGPAQEMAVHQERGWATVDPVGLEAHGWEQEARGDTLWLRFDEVSVRLVAGSPFFSLGDAVLQLADVPYRDGATFRVPMQLLVDVLPQRTGGAFTWDPVTRTVSQPGTGEPPTDAARPKRVVVIDPGHGGDDTGTRGRGGTLEKDVALGVALALYADLQADTMLEVHLLRERDVQVPIWLRGQLATEMKGPRPGVFVSLHANALPPSVPGARATRGYETYVLSEARTDHERRVVALENSAATLEADPSDGPPDELGVILNELRNLDHQHWSVLLAELVQEELGRAHPGPSRGVKQGPLAVITNALMPSVLVELGFLTNARDERMLASEEFQTAAGRRSQMP